MTANGAAGATARVNPRRFHRRLTSSQPSGFVMSGIAIINERRAGAAQRSTQTRSALWSLWHVAVMIGAPLLSIAVPGALAYFAYQTFAGFIHQLA
ncbi:MAG: hypothetical protein F9K44_01760 [Hyphomicrobiaceae bacterium]|nr:MAG: hypothetical protein F9K44_01760 [Hyphomicrobiaceae bacterium]